MFRHLSYPFFRHLGTAVSLTLSLGAVSTRLAWAQSTQPIQPAPLLELPPQNIPRADPPKPAAPPILPAPPAPQLLSPPEVPQPAVASPAETIFVRRFEIVGSTVFKPSDFDPITQPYINRELTFAELLQVRSLITKLYLDRQYLTSAAILPLQTLTNGIVKIQVIEGAVETINVTGNRRLQQSYIRSRVRLGTQRPLNAEHLLEQLRLLQLDPLISSISAELQAGTQPGTSILQIKVAEAKTRRARLTLDNGRSPSVGTFRRQLELSQVNLSGIGDELSFGYTNTEGSNGIDLSYAVPLNPQNGTLRLSFGLNNSSIIEKPFDFLDISAKSRYFEVSYRQPVLQRPTQEVALGLTFSRQESDTSLGLDNIGPFQLTPGADDQGRTRISALRFFQDYVQRDERQVFAVRSQFSLGLNLFNATQNLSEPDSRFFAWRGQAQWTRLLARDSLFLVRGDLQLSDRALVPLEQIGIGGPQTIRGYRQDALLSSNGFLFSTELRLPLLRLNQGTSVLQFTPFFDVGTGWGGSVNASTGTLASVGIGFLWRQADDLSMQLTWGIPLLSTDFNKHSLQEKGVYLLLRYSPSF